MVHSSQLFHSLLWILPTINVGSLVSVLQCKTWGSSWTSSGSSVNVWWTCLYAHSYHHNVWYLLNIYLMGKCNYLITATLNTWERNGKMSLLNTFKKLFPYRVIVSKRFQLGIYFPTETEAQQLMSHYYPLYHSYAL